MKNTKNFIVFTFAFVQSCLFLTNELFAQNKKRVSKTTKKVSSTREKLASPSSNVNLQITEDSTRAGTASRVGRVNASTSSSSTSSVDDDTAAQLLADNLQACIQSQCDGDVPFEKCFKTGQAEYLVRINETCKDMYDDASNDMIRVKAMNLLNTKIKSYFSESCSSAGGKVSGNDCKIDICYFAKGGEGKNAREVKRCNTYKVGQSFTCSPTTFGLNSQDLEYSEGLSTTDMATLIQSGMGILQGAITTTASAIDAVQASKELKVKSNVKGTDCKCTWNQTTYTLDCGSPENNCKQVWSKCTPNGTKKDCGAVIPGETIVMDSYGVYYKSKNGNGDGKVSENSCSTFKPNENPSGTCDVIITEYTEVARLEKEAELYKKFVDFNQLQRKDTINNIANQLAQGQVIASFQSNYNTNTSSDYTVCGIGVGSVGSYGYTDFSELAKKWNASNSANQVSAECSTVNSIIICKKLSAECNNAIWDAAKGNYIVNAKTASSASPSSTDFDVNKIVTNLEKLNTTQYATNNYSSAVSDYNEKVKSANEKKSELEELQERKDQGLANAISSGTATLVQQGTALTTTLISASNNKGVMTGSCYLGDPQNGGIYFAGESQSKTISWKNM